MRLASMRVQNFRAFSDETIHFNDYTCLLGPNGGGKSTILTALNIFFRETDHSLTDMLKLEKEDFHHRDTTKPIVITVTFVGLSPEAQADFKDYMRQGMLVVTAKAVWNEDDACAHVLQYGERLGIAAFGPFFAATGDGTSVKDLKEHYYVPLRESYLDLPAPGTKQAMIDSLHAYELAHTDKCTLIPSEDQFYGISKGSDRLNKYVQWIFVPAVKNVSDEQTEGKQTALGMLLERTVRTTVTFKEPMDKLRVEFSGKYQGILDAQQASLSSLSTSLNRRLAEWAHPDTSLALEWRHDAATSIRIAEPLAQIIAGEGAFKGKLARFGNGLQRSLLLALLEELSGRDAAVGPKLLLGCEEPELYQHPPQARHLASVLHKLTTKNSQVLVCTHSPYFVSGRTVEDVRSIRCDSVRRSSFCRSVTLCQIAESIANARGEVVPQAAGMMLKIQQALHPALNELFFTNVLILAEGVEDVAYISTYLTLMNLWEDFRRLGCHLVPAGGKSSIAAPLVIAQHLNVPTFIVFDSDGHNILAEASDSAEAQKRKSSTRPKHEKDNIALLKLCGVVAPDPFPVDTLWRVNAVMWKSEIGAIVTEELGKDTWATIGDTVRTTHGIDVGDINKNSLFIGYRLMEAWNQGKKSKALEKLCQAIIGFATGVRTPPAAVLALTAPVALETHT